MGQLSRPSASPTQARGLLPRMVFPPGPQVPLQPTLLMLVSCLTLSVPPQREWKEQRI